jgi:hypothetical protein
VTYELPVVGEVWHRVGGKEWAKVTRVWSSDWFCGGGTFVRCQSLHGGKAWTALADDFVLRFEREVPA